MFTAPAATSALKPVEIEGHLLVIEPSEYIPSMVTSMGESDAIRCTVHDITDKETHTDILWFSKVLVKTLKSREGERVLAVMAKGLAKPGQSAPWILQDATGDAKAVKAATDYLNNRTAASMKSPSDEDSALAEALKNLDDITA